MEELIPIKEQNGKRIVSARDLHIFLESKQDFSTWIKNRIEKYDLVENVDYAVFHKIMENPNGGRPQIEYALTVNAAKELSMVEGNEKGKQARRYFIKCEEIAKSKVESIRRNLTPDINGYTVEDKMVAIEYASRILNLNDVSKLSLVKSVMDPMGLPTPDYVPSKGVIKSATELLKENGIQMSAIAFNKIAMNKGILVELERKSSHGKKKFKNISNDWMAFGENQVNPNNPKETQPLWYTDKFRELLKIMNIL